MKLKGIAAVPVVIAVVAAALVSAAGYAAYTSTTMPTASAEENGGQMMDDGDKGATDGDAMMEDSAKDDAMTDDPTGEGGMDYDDGAMAGEDKMEKDGSAMDDGNAMMEDSVTYTVDIRSFAYSPSVLTVHEGDKVVWTNYDSVRHTVTSDEGDELDSGLLPRGGWYSHTFDEAGTFSYHCTPHPNMKATVIVE